ncbi:MAG: hypothetical protein QOK49_3859 [Baekduia sp.]|jgi:hypothetical protein|nr:hypothetical protein [Baekduia sp.]
MARGVAEEHAYDMPASVISPVLYIESDLPEGMTLAEWRRRVTRPQPRHGFTRWARSQRRA